ncbi:hypothetical protein HK405_013175, partial [Cladochytrium tenue]
KTCNLVLNARYMFRLQENEQEPSAVAYRAGASHYRGLFRSNRSCVLSSIHRNARWRELHKPEPLPDRAIPYEPIKVYKERPPPANIEKIITIRWCDEDLQAAQATSTARMSAQLQNFGTSGHPLIGSATLFPRDVARNLVHWLLGQICIHQQCIKCDAAGLDTTLSRAHAIDCLGLEPDILAAVPLAALGGVPMDGGTILDEAIRHLPTGPDG